MFHLSTGVKKLPKEFPLILSKKQILLPGCPQTVLYIKQKDELILIMQSYVKDKSKYIGVAHSLAPGTIGTAAIVLTAVDNCATLVGVARFRVNKIISSEPYRVADVTQLDFHANCKDVLKKPEIRDLIYDVQEAYLSMIGPGSSILLERMKQRPDCYLPELASFSLQLSIDEQLKLLDTLDFGERLKFVLTLFRTKDRKLRTLIKLPMHFHMGPMRRQTSNELIDLQKRLKDAKFPPIVEKISTRDFQSITRIPPHSSEYGVLYSYLNLLADLPWTKFANESLDLPKVKQDLEKDHYGLDTVKQRILEYLAVRKLRNANDSDYTGPVLCLVGPPGVGKTSIARSIASALNRPFVRVSLGGVSDMTEIRGHRRTYVGAMPGRIIQAIKQTGVKNPVILLDEIDKMTCGVRGNPASALLEVLDPSQNKEFMDHYLNIPFDLSQILFLATANTVTKLSPALRDRLEIINISGYTYIEKLQIVLSYLLPKQLKENGLTSNQIVIPKETVKVLINNYTREAGVRAIERKLGSLCRSVAVQIAFNATIPFPIVIDVQAAKDILGPMLWDDNKWTSRLGRPGVAIGLVVKETGGDTLAVESNFMPGSGKLTLTGMLGEVMQESAHLAWGWVRANANMYGIDLDGKRLNSIDVHIHFPEGATSKEGPSAGVTIATTLMSLFLDRPIMSNIAMTGEITLQGLVLPVGGIKDKVIAAHKDGFTKIIIPQKNAKNLHSIPSSIKDELTFVLVPDMHTIMETVGFTVIDADSLKNKL